MGSNSEEVCSKIFQRNQQDTGCEVLYDAMLVSTETIYESYFAGKPPFNTGRKKDEFPDALALHALERTAACHDRMTRTLTVHRGTNEIGGSCIELRSTSGERLILDIGRPLDVANDAKNL